MKRGFFRILLYVVFGPFIGSIGAVFAIGVSTLVRFGSFRDFQGMEALVSPPILIVSYTLGVIPALLTAIVGIVIERQMTGWRIWLWSALSGALIACILGWVVFGWSPLGDELMPVVFMSVIGSAGALAGFVCAALFDALALRFGSR
jgi:hypothetical protein